jgi:hypothetical protein
LGRKSPFRHLPIKVCFQYIQDIQRLTLKVVFGSKVDIQYQVAIGSH